MANLKGIKQGMGGKDTGKGRRDLTAALKRQSKKTRRAQGKAACERP